MTKDGAWRTGSMGFCMKEDCLNRDRITNTNIKYCDLCWKLSLYKPEKRLDKPEKKWYTY